jgi:hypothetical protein
MSETKQRNPEEDKACKVTCPDCHLTIVHERPRPVDPGPAVPAQEAPLIEYVHLPSGAYSETKESYARRRPAEPQAGAQEAPGEPLRSLSHGREEGGIILDSLMVQRGILESRWRKNPESLAADSIAMIDSLQRQEAELWSTMPEPQAGARDAPRCEYCGPFCHEGAEHEARVKVNARYTNPLFPSPHLPLAAEPQACAQVPSQDELKQDIETELFLRRGDDRSEAAVRIAVRERVGLLSQIEISNNLRGQLTTAENAIAHITAYATEAAKTPITRESILAAPCQHEWETRHESWICGAGTHSDSYEVCTKCGTVQDQTVEAAPIPDDLKELYELSKRAKLAGREMVYCGLIERIGRAEAEVKARKLTELSQFDEMQGLCRLILSESGGSK